MRIRISLRLSLISAAPKRFAVARLSELSHHRRHLRIFGDVALDRLHEQGAALGNGGVGGRVHLDRHHTHHDVLAAVLLHDRRAHRRNRRHHELHLLHATLGLGRRCNLREDAFELGLVVGLGKDLEGFAQGACKPRSDRQSAIRGRENW